MSENKERDCPCILWNEYDPRFLVIVPRQRSNYFTYKSNPLRLGWLTEPCILHYPHWINMLRTNKKENPKYEEWHLPVLFRVYTHKLSSFLYIQTYSIISVESLFPDSADSPTSEVYYLSTVLVTFTPLPNTGDVPLSW